MSRELTYLITEENIGTSPLTIHGFLKGRGYSHAVPVSYTHLTLPTIA